MSATEVHVLRDRCMGTAMCAAIAPEAFGIDGTGHALYIHAGNDSHDDAVDPAGDHHANPWQHDRNHIASDPGWQLIDHRMQFHAGRPTD